MFRKMKWLINYLLRRDFFIRVDKLCEIERFGSKYGGWVIAPKRINSESIIYSFGIGEDASFDVDMIQRFGVKVHAFDPTPKSIEWVHRQNFPANFILHEYGLADFDGESLFNPPENPHYVSYTILERPSTKMNAICVQMKKLETIMKDLGHTKIDLLKMDIEGAEYRVIEELINSNIRPNQLLIEFHHRFPGVGIKKTKDAIEKLRKIGYSLFSISESHLEFSFVLS
jgi:FkbM family methyltransferase